MGFENPHVGFKSQMWDSNHECGFSIEKILGSDDTFFIFKTFFKTYTRRPIKLGRPNFDLICKLGRPNYKLGRPNPFR